MSDKEILLEINDFRAISEASISINGITVVSGINSSGKSTISKLFYYIFNLSNKFSELVLKNNASTFDVYRKTLEKMIENSRYFRNDDLFRREMRVKAEFNRRFRIPNNYLDYNKEDLIRNINRSIEIIKEYYKDSWGYSIDRRMAFFISDVLYERNKDPQEIDYDMVFSHIESGMNKLIDKLYSDYEEKPREYLDVELVKAFHSSISGSIEISEYDNVIYSNKLKVISEPLLINNAVYIDTPMAFNSDNENNSYWDELNELLKHNTTTYNDALNQISSIISDDILFAEVNLEEDPLEGRRILYKRKIDNLELELSDCATGIKSLSLILLLIKNGTINNQTLLILDEPEIHLHPQWVIEYARILILLREKIGCRIFISSHSPDMVQAIKMFSEKVNMQDEVIFYLAEDDENKPGKFKYLNLGNSISEIFKCFNKSLDKIDEYDEYKIFAK